MILIGDVHSYFKQYESIIQDIDESIQMGDMFVGLPNTNTPNEWKEKAWYYKGNHDHPFKSLEHPNYLGDFGYLPDHDIFFVGGALSPNYRKLEEGKDWWKEEQLSHEQFYKVLKLYEETKPSILISHDAPRSVANKFGYGNSSLTQHMLEMMTYIHKPSLAVHGHYHSLRRNKFNGIEFLCIGILDQFDTVTGKIKRWNLPLE